MINNDYFGNKWPLCKEYINEYKIEKRINGLVMGGKKHVNIPQPVAYITQ